MVMHTQIMSYASSDIDARINQATMSGFFALLETLQAMATTNIG
jgi:hypothetical protein